MDSEPNNAVVLAELAKTYDLMQLHDRANDVWRKLQEMGPSAGAAYELADQRLKLGAPTPAAAPMPTAPDSSSREASTSAHNLALNLKIDGRTAANIVQGRRYDDFVPAGRHMLTVSAVPNYQPTSTVLIVQDGQTYVFTATRRQNTDSVVLVPSTLPPGQPH